MKHIPLIHPIYLDVPMLVSFTAALQGGFSLEAEVIAEKKKGNEIQGDTSGKLALNSLFKVIGEVEGNAAITGNKTQEILETRKESKAYTEASIAINLYNQLREAKEYIQEPKDFKEFSQYSPGTLIEIGGTVEKNAVDTIIDCIDAINILSKLANPTKPTKTSKKQSFSSQDSQSSKLHNIRSILDDDRKRTPISNIIVSCSQPNSFKAVVTLRTENLRDLTLSELNKNSVRVVGKITRVIPTNEKIISFENYGMAMLYPNILKKMFSSISDNSEVAIDFAEVEVHGPAIQILPLMIFV